MGRRAGRSRGVGEFVGWRGAGEVGGEFGGVGARGEGVAVMGGCWVVRWGVGGLNIRGFLL